MVEDYYERTYLIPDSCMCRHETFPGFLDLGRGRAEVLWWFKASLTLTRKDVTGGIRSCDHVVMEPKRYSMNHRAMSGR